jgi:hypothetical protein
MGLHRTSAIAAMLACVVLASADAAQPATPPQLAHVERANMVTAAQVQAWLDARDAAGPAYTGGPAWKTFMALIHDEIERMGLVNVVDHAFPYTRWYTSEYPDKSGWSFTSDGTRVDVASYGTQTGSTGPNGVTAQMVLYDLTLPVAKRPPLAVLKGKIVVVKQQPWETFGTAARVPLGVAAPATQAYCGNPPACTPPHDGEGPPSPQWKNPGPQMSYRDYEYRSDPETFPTPLFEKIPLSVETSFRNRDQFGGQIRDVIFNVLMPSGAAGAVTVMDMSPLASAGARIHPTPRQSNMPLLMLDRIAGAKVLADAAAGKTATLVLDAHEEEHATAYETVATLPGKDYGTPNDKAVLLATHIDGPSLVEDDGALGILSVLHYYASVPQRQRPKSIVVYFESRHFVPGTEGSYPLDITKELPDIFKTVVGGLALEHFGGLQFAENRNVYAPTGKAATTYIWGWPNPLAIDAAIAAIKDQNVPRAIHHVPAKPGIHGMAQLNWLGGGFSRYLVDLGGWPGWHISGDWPSAGFQAYYPAAHTRIGTDVFLKQTAAAVQLTNVLMTQDVVALAPAWGYLHVAVTTLEDKDVKAGAASTRAQLAKDFDAVFAHVKAGRYDAAKAALPSLSADAERLLVPASVARVKAAVADATIWADRGIAWQATK